MVLPLSGFTAIPNPYMVPFMGLQSYVIGIMFGMGFQGGKRKISAMTNEQFNALDIHRFAFDEMHAILKNIPSVEQMFAEMRPMVEIMAKELGNLIRSLPDLIQTVVTEPAPQGGASLPPPGIPGFLTPVIGIPNPEQTLPGGGIPPPPKPIPPFVGPTGPLPGPLTQQQLLDKYANWKIYRQNGGLLTEQKWRLARRGEPGGIPVTPPRTSIPKDESGKTFHPAFFRQIKSLTNNRLALLKQLDIITIFIAEKTATLTNLIKQRQQSGSPRNNSLINSITREIQQKQRDVITLTNQARVIQKAINDFNNKFTPFK